MAQPKTTIWDLEPHTSAKHEILRRYLQAWAPILSQGRFPHLVIVDGFAGPGRYSKGEEGSPIIAIKAVIEQSRPIGAKVDYHFIELDSRRAEHLASEIAMLTVPPNVTTTIHSGRSFQDTFPEVWRSYDPKPGRSRPPTFVFIDPFGFKIPFSYVEEVLRASSCEVLVNFMFEEINRFLAQEQQPDNFDELFGCSDWREGIEIKEPAQRVKFLHDLYTRQLRQAAGARFVRSFAMRNERNTMDYFLFFATNNELGIKKMKEAMWRVDLILQKFGGRDATVKDVEQFVVCETPFRETHHKKVLKELEEAGGMAAIDPPAKRRRGQFGDPGMMLRFKPAAGS